MSDGKWSEWIDWNGGECPLTPNTEAQYTMKDECVGGPCYSKHLNWEHRGEDCDIIAYRYKIKEPESDMHPDLEWLARNVSEWGGTYTYSYIFRSYDFGDADYSAYKEDSHIEPTFSKDEWLQARKDLGLTTFHDFRSENKEPGIMTPEEEEMPAEEYKAKIGGPRKAENFLMQAADLMSERGKQYDQPSGERSMGKAVAALNAITGRDLTEAEGWLLMSLVKRVRQHSGAGYHQDSAEDSVAYAALEAEALESAV